MDGSDDYCSHSKQIDGANCCFPAEDRRSTHLRRSRVFHREECATWSVDTLVSIPRQPREVYFVKMRFPEDRTDNGGSFVSIDQFSGISLDVFSTRNASPAQRVVNLNRALHTGAIGGDTGRLLAALASLALPLQAITGAWLWWTKRRSRKRSRIASECSVVGNDAAATR
jgi:hypothetical protein